MNDTPSPHWFHPSYLLSYPLAYISKIIPFINVYLLYIYGLLVCSAIAVLQVACPDKNSLATSLGQGGLLFACYILIFIAQDMMFAPISFLAAGCGCMLIFDKLYRREFTLSKLLPGIALFYGGAILRHDSCLGFAPFIGMSSLFLLKRESDFKRWFKANVRRLFLPVACVALLLFIPAFQHYLAQDVYPGGGNLVDIQTSRMYFFDYPDRSGIDKTQEYTKRGIDPASVRLLENYLYEDSSTQTPEWWANAKFVRSIENSHTKFDKMAFWYTVGVLSNNKFFFTAIILLTIWNIFTRQGVGKLYPIALLVAYIAGILACCVRLRCNFFSPIASLTFFYIPMLFVSYKNAPKETTKSSFTKAATLTTLSIVPIITMLACRFCDIDYYIFYIIITLIFPMAYLAKRQTLKPIYFFTIAFSLAFFAIICKIEKIDFTPFGGFRQTYGKYSAEHHKLIEYATLHPERIILCQSYPFRDLAYPSTALFFPREPYVKNIIEFGNWKTILPHRQAQRKLLGIDNEVLCVFDDRIRVVLPNNDNLPHLRNYLKDHYGIIVSIIKECALGDKYSIFRFSCEETAPE